LSLESSEVDLFAARRLYDLAKTIRLYTSARQYFDSMVGIFDQPLDEGCTLRSGILLAAGQDASKPELDQLIQRPKGVRRNIESAVKDSLPIPDEFPDAPAPFLVDAAVGIQYPKYNSIRASLAGKQGIAFHDRHFRLGVAESTCARSNHNHDRDLQPGLGFDNRAQRGR
jgi:hypothetical protein